MELWDGGAAFENGLASLVLEPCKHATAFDSTYNRLRRCVAVLGNERADKAGYLIHYCEKHAIGFYVFEFELSASVSHNLATMQDALRKNYAAPTQPGTNNVLILTRAERMAYECDTPDAAAFATELEVLAETLSLVVICLIGRTPMQAREGNPKHVQRFFSQVQCDPSIVLVDCQAIIDNYVPPERSFRAANW